MVDTFGICDDPPIPGMPAKPAYLDYADSDKWIAWVDNSAAREVTFTAIDHCIEILRPNGEEESSCDGMLTYAQTLVFVELKDRDSGRWVGKARDPLQITIDKYRSEASILPSVRKEAYIVNKQRPTFYAGSAAINEQFETDTGGFILHVKDTIMIH